MLQESYDSLQAIGNQRNTDTQIISNLEPQVLRLTTSMNSFHINLIIRQ